jgi:hypothetical protein
MNPMLLAGTGLLALIHLFAGRLPVISHLPRPVWVSCAGGVAAAYVFLHLLPEMAGEAGASALGQAIAYPIALAGTLAYVGVDRLGRRGSEDERGRRAGHAFVPHMGAFALYNGLVGYMLVRREAESLLTEALYVFALGMHLLVVDRALRRDHAEDYDRAGRWVMAAAVVAGSLLGAGLALPPIGIEAGFAFLAGGMIVNVIKEELPERGRFLPFLGAAAAYGVLLLATGAG